MHGVRLLAVGACPLTIDVVRQSAEVAEVAEDAAEIAAAVAVVAAERMIV